MEKIVYLHGENCIPTWRKLYTYMEKIVYLANSNEP